MAQAIKAYVSLKQSVLSGGNEYYLAIAALAEAQRILADAEPFVPSRDEFKVDRRSDTEHSNIGPLAMLHEPYKALAESLAAITADGGPLDELEWAIPTIGQLSAIQHRNAQV